jgi:hypothetical protein
MDRVSQLASAALAKNEKMHGEWPSKAADIARMTSPLMLPFVNFSWLADRLVLTYLPYDIAG